MKLGAAFLLVMNYLIGFYFILRTSSSESNMAISLYFLAALIFLLVPTAAVMKNFQSRKDAKVGADE